MAVTIHHRRRELQALKSLVGLIRERIEALDDLMHGLCAATCHCCRDNCCRRATVWYDFKDLLAFHLGMAPVPGRQLTKATGAPCPHLVSRGCSLTRIQRPFVCTWFICSAQRRILDQWPASRGTFLMNSLKALKDGRNRLENNYIQIVMS